MKKALTAMALTMVLGCSTFANGGIIIFDRASETKATRTCTAERDGIIIFDRTGIIIFDRFIKVLEDLVNPKEEKCTAQKSGILISDRSGILIGD